MTRPDFSAVDPRDHHHDSLPRSAPESWRPSVEQPARGHSVEPHVQLTRQPSQPSTTAAGVTSTVSRGVREGFRYGRDSVRNTQTNTLAIIALISAMAGVATFIFAPVGAVLGHVAINHIRQNGQAGAGLARAAVVVGWSVTGLGILAALLGIVVLIVQGTYWFTRIF